MSDNDVVLSGEYRLLLHDVLNEVLNGFAVSDFESAVGSENKVKEFFAEVCEIPEVNDCRLELSQCRIEIFRNALRETLRELCVEEFHTRTGIDFEEGERSLSFLTELLLS